METLSGSGANTCNEPGMAGEPISSVRDDVGQRVDPEGSLKLRVGLRDRT